MTAAARTKLLPLPVLVHDEPIFTPLLNAPCGQCRLEGRALFSKLVDPIRCMSRCITQCIRPVAVLEGQPSSLITSLIAHHPRRLAKRTILICTHLQPRLPTGPAAGEGKPAFENIMRYLNLRFLPGPRAQLPSEWSTVWVTCVRPRLDRRPDHLLVRPSTASGGKIGARILGRMT